MSIELSDIKKYLRIQHDLDDDFIKSLVDTSKAFIKEQTGVAHVAGDKVYEQGILFHVAHLYDNRSSISDKATNEIPFTLDAIIRHIKIRGAYEQG
jgi:uncharacterized phage protein (predicted DNA packaging)